MEVAYMITYWQIIKNGLLPLQTFSKGSVIYAVAPTTEEISILKSAFTISEDFLLDIMDVDERSRVELDGDNLNIIYRIPVYNPENGIPYSTFPLGIVLSDEALIVICQQTNDVMADVFSKNLKKNAEFLNKIEFLFHIIDYSTSIYLKYLKQINFQTNAIERDLERSTKNKELHKLLLMEKCLVYFNTSLRSNEILIHKLRNSKYMRGDEVSSEWIDDLTIEIKQAIETTNIYSDILSGMMDAFASVISNNLNIVMKQLTVITIILMIPTLIASFFGMNVPNGMENNSFAIYGIMLFSLLLSAIGVLLIRNKRWI